MKRILSLILFLVTTVVMWAYDIAVMNSDGVTIYYNYINDGTELEVTEETASYKSYRGAVVIPAEVTYYDKTYSVTSIGERAFQWRGLTSVKIPNSVTSIGDNAFSDCSNLTSITIPNSVTSIGEMAFYGCSSLTSVTIGNSVTSIGRSTFYKCSSLYSVTIPNSVTSIGENAFYECSGLSSVTIGNSVKSIGSYAFEGCTNLSSVTIGNSVTSIGARVFQGCSYLTSIMIPNSVKSIGSYAFEGCSNLSSVTIGNSVTSIGGNVFYGCSNLTSIKVESGNTKYDSRDNCNAIIETTSNTIIVGCKNTAIPNSVTSIGNNAFYGCSYLTSITIPNSVTSIGEWAFYDCSGLTSITIPNSVTTIGYAAFYKCKSLTSVVIPNSVTCLGGEEISSEGLVWGGGDVGSVFSGCTGLTSVKIGNGVKSIPEFTFCGCTSLTSIVNSNSITTIGLAAFKNCTSLTSIVIPNSVTVIDRNAFYGCNSLAYIEVPDNLTSIGEDAFSNCSGLEDFYCYMEKMPNIIASNGSPTTKLFEESNIEQATLHVPSLSIGNYMSTAPWNGFGKIVPLENEHQEVPKCATPTIVFENGKLTFSCETEDVEYISEVTIVDCKKNYSDEVIVSGVYKVSVYATKAGYENSDTVTQEFTANGLVGDVNGDGVVDISDYIGVANIILTGKP